MSENVEFYEVFYREGKARWSGKPNRSLVDEVTGLAAGRALDLGCGQGGDAIWLAGQGWAVTGVDVVASALDQAAEHAAEAGVSVRWERHDLEASLPEGPFDLVTATFLHSPVAFPYGEILRRAAERVGPGGTLLVIGHAPSAAHQHGEDLLGAGETLALLALAEGAWEVQVCEERAVTHAFKGEAPIDRVDAVVRVARR